jgi:hypothetical protein
LVISGNLHLPLARAIFHLFAIGLAQFPTETLPPPKMKKGKEKVKFRMLYQPLTKVCSLAGKEKKFGSGLYPFLAITQGADDFVPWCLGG